MDMVIEDTRVAPPAVAKAAPAQRAPKQHAVLPSEYLTFRLGGEEYGIDTLRVQEIRRYETPTRIAGAPDFIKGIVNLRGVIVPIIDLRLKLACTTADYTEVTVVIVLNVRGRVVGAVVDAVSDVLALQADDIKAAPELHSAMDAGHIMGIGCLKTGDTERVLILTDIEALMCDAGMGWVEPPAH